MPPLVRLPVPFCHMRVLADPPRLAARCLAPRWKAINRQAYRIGCGASIGNWPWLRMNLADA